MSKQSLVIAIIILIAVAFVAGYIIYDNVAREIIEERKDEIVLLLKDVKNSTDLSFNNITETEFSWMVEEEGKIKELRVLGKEMRVEKVPGSEIHKINDFLGEPNDHNTFNSVISGLTGFKRDDIVCSVVRRLCSKESCDGKTCITTEDFENDLYDLTVKCGYLNLESEPLASGEIIKAKTIEVNNGDDFEIRLKANLSTGYQWRPDFVPEYLEITGINYETLEEDKLGSEGEEVFKIKALKPGSTELSFSYIKPWEDKPPIKKALYLIKINGE